MKRYEVTIWEFLKRTIQVEAESLREAEVEARRQWDNSEIILTADDFDHVDFSAKQVRERNEER